MTTANLSVGLITRPALTALKELKDELRTLANTDIRINATSLNAGVVEALRGREFRVNLKPQTGLVSDIQSAIKTAVRNPKGASAYEINFDWQTPLNKFKSELAALGGAKLTGLVMDEAGKASLQASVQAALNRPVKIVIDEVDLADKVNKAVHKGANLYGVDWNDKKPAQQVVTAPFNQAALVTALTQALVPSMDRMANSVADAMKSVGTGRSSAPRASATRYSASQSARRDDGTTIRSTTVLDGDAAAAELRKLKSDEDLFRAERKRLEAWFAIREESDRRLNRTDQYIAMGQKARAEAESRIKAQEALDSKVFLASERTRLDQWFAAREETSRRLNRTDQYIAMGQKARAEAEDRAKKAAKAQAQFDEKGWSYGPDRKTIYALQDREAVAMRKVAEAQAASRTPRSDPIDKSMLTGEQSIRRNVDAMRSWRVMANEVHSGARGLTGAFGALWLTWGSLVPLAAGAAFGSVLRDVLSTGKAVEYQLAFVSALSRESMISITSFGQAVRGSMALPNEAAEGMRALAQNGLNARASLMALPDVLALATVGEMNLSEAALGATGVMAAFNLEVTDLGRVSDVFAKAAASSNTSVASMVESMRQASTVSDKYHISIEDTAAALATMAQRNITGSAAGTAFRNMMVELATPTERARESMKRMGLEVFDSNKRLLGFDEILDRLQKSTAKLNEQGRLAFLNDLFNERGAKAANAILSDFEKFKDFQKEITENSDGFTRSVVTALQSTTEGRIRSLITEFKLSTADAFGSAKGEIDSFLNTLRQAAGSEEFQNLLRNTTSGVVAFTAAVVDNAKWVGIAAGVWAGGKLAMAAWAVALPAVTAGVTALGFAATGLTVAVTGVIRALGPLAIAGTLALLFYDLVKAKNQTVEASERLRVEADLETKTLVANSRQLDEKLAQLKLQIQLMTEGKSLTDATRMSEEQLMRSRLQANVTGAALLLSEAQRADAAENARFAAGGAMSAAHLEIQRQRSGASQAVSKAREALSSAEAAMAAFESGVGKAAEVRSLSLMSGALGELREYNKEAEKANKAFGKEKFTVFAPEDLAAFKEVMSPEAMREAAQALKDELNKGKLDYAPAKKGPTPEKLARDQYSAEFSGTLKRLRDEEAQLKDVYEFQKKLDEIKYDSGRYGPYLAQLLAEQRAVEFSTKSLEAEIRAIQDLTAAKIKAKGSGVWSDADETRFQDEVGSRASNYQAIARRRDQDQALAAAQTEAFREKDMVAQQKSLENINREADAYIAKLTLSKQIKVVDPVEAASQKAAFEVQAKFADEIRRAEEKVSELTVGRDRLVARINEEYDGLSSTQDEILASQERELRVQLQHLGVLKEMSRLKGEKAGGIAGQLEVQSSSSEAGFARFWAEYTSASESAADTTYRTWKSATDKMSEGMANFVSGGKVNFKSLMQSIAADLMKLEAQKAFRNLFMMLGKAVLGGGPTTGQGVDVPLGGRDPIASANGNIMTKWGPAVLRTFQGGGIATGPMVSVFGEGSRPEAYVPLPDGRTIPVTVQGASSRAVQITYAPVINVDAASDRAQVMQNVYQVVGESQKQFLEQLREQGVLA